MSIAITPHAIARFRERFPGLCRNDPTDESIRSTILTCLDHITHRTTGVSASGDAIETVRTRYPFAIRAVLLKVEVGHDVLTVLPSAKTKGDRTGQKARYAARRSGASCAPS